MPCRSRDLLLALVVPAVSACGAPEPSVESPPAGASPIASAGSDGPSPASASASPSAAPTAPADAPPVVCPLFADLFQVGRRSSYVVVDEVDPHGPVEPGEDPLIRSSQTLTCTVAEIEVEGDVTSAPLDCVVGDGDVPGILAIEGFRIRDGALALGLVGAVADAAWLGCEPALGTTPFDGVAFLGGSDRCTLEVHEEAAHGLCRTERCPHGGYGNAPSVHQVCFAKGRGLTRQLTENINGPRTTEWVLSKP